MVIMRKRRHYSALILLAAAFLLTANGVLHPLFHHCSQSRPAVGEMPCLESGDVVQATPECPVCHGCLFTDVPFADAAAVSRPERAGDALPPPFALPATPNRFTPARAPPAV